MHTHSALSAIRVNSLENWHYRLNLIFDPRLRRTNELSPLANRFRIVSSLSFSKDYRKSIFCLRNPREDSFQLISQLLQFFGWQMPAERMKERRVPFRIATVIGSFVCCSINCTYQILSAFICLLCAHRRHNGWKETKAQSGTKSIKPLLSLFELSMRHISRGFQVPDNYAMHRYNCNLIYHFKRERSMPLFAGLLLGS